MSKQQYEECMKTGEQYFGPYMGAKQVWDKRAPLMKMFIESIVYDTLQTHVLEIGSWAGSSAVIWAESLESCGSVVCVDTWETNYEYAIPDEMGSAYHDDLIFKLFKHNMKKYDNVITIRADSSVISLFKKEFHLVYVDGDHSYRGCFSDLENAKSCAIRWIAGDDLELQYGEVDQEYARSVCNNIDFVRDPKTGSMFHPGVTCAVWDAFGHVDCGCGFWRVRL